MFTPPKSLIPDDIQKYVQQLLQQIEQEKGIKILYACESGSRAWGFGSPDSDYDVRFLYVYPQNSYLNLKSPQDTLSTDYDHHVDLSAWELRKGLQLVSSSNATVWEWLQSPIVYLENTEFTNELWQVSQPYFSPRKLIFHYLGIAKGMLDQIQANQISIKKYFYVLRPVLAAHFIATRQSVPPMEFYPLVENISQENTRNEIYALWEQKMISKEGEKITIPSKIQRFIEESMEASTNFAKVYQKDNSSSESLDLFFRKWLW